jgi:hypothetical protein
MINKKNKLVQLQQGDVTLEQLKSLPDGLTFNKVEDQRGIVLAEGEVTGHYHGIADSNAQLLEAVDSSGTKRRFLCNNSDKTISLTHQEHKPIVIDPGIYEVGLVNEYDYLSQMVRKVQD